VVCNWDATGDIHNAAHIIRAAHNIWRGARDGKGRDRTGHMSQDNRLFDAKRDANLLHVSGEALGGGFIPTVIGSCVSKPRPGRAIETKAALGQGLSHILGQADTIQYFMHKDHRAARRGAMQFHWHQRAKGKLHRYHLALRSQDGCVLRAVTLGKAHQQMQQPHQFSLRACPGFDQH